MKKSEIWLIVSGKSPGRQSTLPSTAIERANTAELGERLLTLGMVASESRGRMSKKNSLQAIRKDIAGAAVVER